MNCVRVSRAWRGSRLPLAALSLLLLAPGGAAAAPPAGGELSPRLAELAGPELRSAPPAEQAEGVDLFAAGPGSLLRDGDRVLVEVRYEQGAVAGLDQLRAAGAEIVHTSRRYQTVTAAVRPADLVAIGSAPRVAGVTEVLAPLTLGADCGGLVRSEGDTHLLASTARPNLGVDGTGVAVGILSDSFDRKASAVTHAASDVASGDLPGPGSPCGSTTPVGVLDDSVSGSDEGRAMAQIVHDLAPGASIQFASAFTGEAGFAANIRALAAAGSRVIVDDVIYFAEPFFQDGPVAVAVDEVSAAGVVYLSAAGNFNQREAGKDIASYEAKFRNPGSCPGAVPGVACTDFDPSGEADRGYNSVVGPGEKFMVDLQWAEPRGGVSTDLDAYLLSKGGALLAKAETRNVTGSQLPFESLEWKNEGSEEEEVRLVISRAAGIAEPTLKFIQLADATATAAQLAISAGDVIGPALFGHTAAAGAISVAAVRQNTTAAPETFSSRGPLTHYFGPVAGVSPAAPLAVPKLIAKPDLAATDGGLTTFFSPTSPAGSFFRFFGTSAAAPHAAAVAALALQANPGATPAQVRTALTSTARPVGSFGADAVGAGLVNAGAAVDALALAPTVQLTKVPAKLSRARHPTIEFAASRPVSFTCLVDGFALPCSSPFTWPGALGDGHHTVLVNATDLSGRVGASTPVGFRVDTKPPRTRIVKHPRKRVLTRGRARVTFRFGSSEGGARFRCKIDRTAYRNCGKKLVKRFPVGEHTLRVKARDAVGNADATPATFRFRVVFAG